MGKKQVVGIISMLHFQLSGGIRTRQVKDKRLTATSIVQRKFVDFPAIKKPFPFHISFLKQRPGEKVNINTLSLLTV